MTAPSLAHRDHAWRVMEKALGEPRPSVDAGLGFPIPTVAIDLQTISVMQRLREPIARALADEHDAALEKAAVEAETWRQACLPRWNHQQAENTAERIRAMKGAEHE